MYVALKSQSQCLVGLTISTLSDILCPDTLDSSEEQLVILKEKTLLIGKKGWKEPSEEPQRRDPSPTTDRHAVDVTCIEQNNKITVYTFHRQNI